LSSLSDFRALSLSGKEMVATARTCISKALTSEREKIVARDLRDARPLLYFAPLQQWTVLSVACWFLLAETRGQLPLSADIFLRPFSKRSESRGGYSSAIKMPAA